MFFLCGANIAFANDRCHERRGDYQKKSLPDAELLSLGFANRLSRMGNYAE